MKFGSIAVIFALIFQVTASPITWPWSFKPYTLTSTPLFDELSLLANYQTVANCLSGNGTIEDGPLDTSEYCTLSDCKSSTATIYASFKSMIGGYILLDEQNKKIMVIFKATTEDYEWLIDFTFLLVDYKPYAQKKLGASFNCFGCFAHLGFYKSVYDYMEKFYYQVEEVHQKYPDFQIYVSGHSLGGAIAALVGIEFKILGLDPIVVTYGQPKVGNALLSNWMDSKFNSDTTISNYKSSSAVLTKNTFTRVTHLGDTVPHLPPTLLGYTHAGCEVQFQSPGINDTVSDIEVLGKFDYGTEIKEDIEIYGPYIASEDWDNIPIAVEHGNYFLKIGYCYTPSLDLSTIS
ncbi:hypothetical protein B5S28_g150 [[Candida] boidinii]|uniref:Unnamed protein product n=1 Tax=Candida boidinii TaxID=5477 RepID=A0ACB5TNT4_CANBO|nr:hypothetical protein B5S28_g150 [[Candida] boidinii]OWB61906.1 hypothetical protein B5S29_g2812 [[Candida] boidinii]OWB71552.1 hypothetical protein B5S31_g1242 [[Candida] boidinii]OWB76319.1 hypothetical protein B5S32_g470 [[Candida] boidinii]GME91899.1 unnamed protein product [[Candida] boidinii]